VRDKSGLPLLSGAVSYHEGSSTFTSDGETEDSNKLGHMYATKNNTQQGTSQHTNVI
jgi:hypothetical protein